MFLKFMNSLKMKQKLIIVLVVCVIIPTIVTNSFFLWSVNNNYKEQQKRDMENIVERFNSELNNSVNELISIADYLDRSEALYSFLEKEYATDSDYYDAYNNLMQNDIIHYYYTAQSVYSITICTANNTITNGTYFVKQSDMQEASWYQAYVDHDDDTMFYCYYEDGRSGEYIERGRHICVIRRLDYFGGSDIIMLDLDYSKLFDSLLLECNETKAYVYSDDGQIIFNTTEANNKKKGFSNWSDLEKDKDMFVKSFKVFDTNINIGLVDTSNLGYEIFTNQKVELLILYMLNLIIPSLLIYLLYRSLHDRVAMTQEYMEKVEDGAYEEIPLSYDSDEIGSMVKSFNLMVERIKELIEVVYKNKEREQELMLAKKQAELNALHSQINPHFMFNALESIRMHSILKNEKETASILESFAVLLRRNIQWNSDFVTIEDECENTRRYLEIQKYRFGQRLEFSVFVQEDCGQYEIPKFSIITFVENSCVHGIEDNIGGGSISVMVTGDEDSLYIEILDSGKGMSESELMNLRERIKNSDIEYIKSAESSVGIANTVIRLRQTYGDAMNIDIMSTINEGTEICIVVPKRK